MAPHERCRPRADPATPSLNANDALVLDLGVDAQRSGLRDRRLGTGSVPPASPDWRAASAATRNPRAYGERSSGTGSCARTNTRRRRVSPEPPGSPHQFPTAIEAAAGAGDCGPGTGRLPGRCASSRPRRRDERAHLARAGAGRMARSHLLKGVGRGRCLAHSGLPVPDQRCSRSILAVLGERDATSLAS